MDDEKADKIAELIGRVLGMLIDPVLTYWLCYQWQHDAKLSLLVAFVVYSLA